MIPLALLDPVDPHLPQEVTRALQDGEIRQGFMTGRPPIIYVPVRHGSAVLAVGPLPDLPGPDLRVLGVLLGAVLVTVVMAGFILVYPVVRRLRVLEKTAIRIGAGNFKARAGISSSGAVGQLARHFDHMGQSVQKLVAAQRLLLQAVSHELRTPIARIRFAMEMLQQNTGVTERAQHLSSIDHDLEELDSLVRELLIYNRYNTDAPSLRKEELDVAAIISELAQRAQQTHSEIRITIDIRTEAELRVCADEKCFVRVIQNLLGNACRHAGSEVTVTVTRHAEEVSIAVSDDGPGIPPEERERVFEPFARLGGSRSRASGGVGLGLAIVATIIELHGGKIELCESPAGGASFVTIWP